MTVRSIFLLLFTLTATRGGPYQTSAPSLEDLAWIVGSWEGEALEGLAEEHWLPARSGTMAGLFRLTSGGKTRVVEFLLIEGSEEGVIYRFKHYSPKMQPWEQTPLTYRLIQAGEDHAVFESPEDIQGKPKRLTYRRVGVDSLTVTVEGATGPSGETESFDVPMKRIR